TGRSRVARLSTVGAVDTGFDPGSGANDTVYAIAVQGDGNVVIGGAFTSFNGTARKRIARLYGAGTSPAPGTLDFAFDPEVTGANPAPDPDTSVLNYVMVQPDGKILLAGKFGY